MLITWWALRTFPELTLEPLKAPQYKGACVPQAQGSVKTELWAPGIQLAAASLGDVDDGLKEQVGDVLSLAASEGSGWLQQTNCSFHNAFFSFRVWLIYQVSLFVDPGVPQCLLMSSQALFHHFPLCDIVLLKDIFLHRGCRHWMKLQNASLELGRKTVLNGVQELPAFLADTNQAKLGHGLSYSLGSRRLGTALLLPPGNAACQTLDHHFLKGCFLLCVLSLIIHLSCHVMTVFIIMNSSGANVHVISTVTGDGKAKQTNQPTNFFLSLSICM